MRAGVNTMSDSVQTDWTIDTILDFLRAHRAELKAMGVTRIGVFGSFVRNQAAPSSDIDLLFDMEDMTFARWMDVWNFLEDSFGRKVDLVPEKDLRAELRSRVLSEVRYVEEL
jgi:uncharacterized protein